MAKFFCFVRLPFYICRGEVEVNKSAKKERGFEHPALLPEQAWLLKDLLYGKENLHKTDTSRTCFPAKQNCVTRPRYCTSFITRGAPGSQGGAVVRALAPYQCNPALALRGFSPCIPVLPFPKTPTLLNSNSIRNTRTRLSELLELLSVSYRKTNCNTRISVIRLILVISLPSVRFQTNLVKSLPSYNSWI